MGHQPYQRRAARHVRRNLSKTAEIGQIQALLLRQRVLLATALVTPDDATITANTAAVDTNIASITRIWNSYLARPHSPNGRQFH